MATKLKKAVRLRRAVKFSLIETIITVGIIALLCTLGASVYQKITREQRLSVAGGAIKSTLDQAKAFALRHQKIVAVYFIDGGINNNGTSLNLATATTPSADYESYLKRPDKKTTPYQIATWLCDNDEPQNDKELARTVLPVGVMWLDVGIAFADVNEPEYRVNYLSEDGSGALETARIANPLYHRWCSLILKFAPDGNMWAEILSYNSSASAKDAVFRDYDYYELPEEFYTSNGFSADSTKIQEAYDNGTLLVTDRIEAVHYDRALYNLKMTRYRNSALKIRVIALDNLVFKNKNLDSDMPFEYSQAKKEDREQPGTGTSVFYNWKNRNKAKVNKRVYWKTVNINYQTGVSRLVNSYNEDDN